MSTMPITAPPTSWLPSGRPFTADDLGALPDDGNRYELVDGMLLVSPAPRTQHQVVVGNLYAILREACLPHLLVLFAPLDVRLAPDTVVQPDVVVARRADLTETNLPTAPLLAVEVLSPSTRAIDLHVKKDRLRIAGCASYWVVDPVDGHLTAWQLDEQGDYVQVADVTGDRTWAATRPFEVELTPSALLR